MGDIYTKEDIQKKLGAAGQILTKATKNSFAAQKLCSETNSQLRDLQEEIAELYKALCFE